MKQLRYMIVIVALLIFVVSCNDAIKNISQVKSLVTEILDGSHEVNGIVTKVTKDTILIEGINVKDVLLTKDPQGEWRSVITDDTVGFVFVPSKDIPADSAGFPKKALIAGKEYPIEVARDTVGPGVSITGSEIMGDKLTIKKEKPVIVAAPQTKSELQTLLAERIKKDGNNADLNDIEVRNITDMRELFKQSPFNGDISQWDVSNVTEMGGMFMYSQFNGNIFQWDVSSVTNMQGMFLNAQFNGDISEWDVSSVTSITSMFKDSKFNGDISKWDVSSVTNMYGMFQQSPFNQDISDWDVSSVKYMSDMFQQSSFNQDISQWDVSNVTAMSSMFQQSPFNQDISQWNVRKVTLMSKMFYEANSMIYNLEAWGSQLHAQLQKSDMWTNSGVEAAGKKPSWA